MSDENFNMLLATGPLTKLTQTFVVWSMPMPNAPTILPPNIPTTIFESFRIPHHGWRGKSVFDIKMCDPILIHLLIAFYSFSIRYASTALG